jgi:hypothetical protein
MFSVMNPVGPGGPGGLSLKTEVAAWHPTMHPQTLVPLSHPSDHAAAISAAATAAAAAAHR